MTDTQILLDPEIEVEEDEPKFSHIIRSEDLLLGYVGQRPVKTLCGILLIPTVNPKDLPICPKCHEIYKQLMKARKGMN